jgi:hypothetical protein
MMAGSVEVRRQLLEILRLTRWPGLDAKPFLGRILMGTYNDLIAAGVVETIPETRASSLLSAHLRERIRENLNLVFLALWITHADMRLAYWSVTSMKSSVAVELLETSLDPTVAGWLIPLIDSLPDTERISRGRRAFPLIRKDEPEHILAVLGRDDDPLTRFLSLCVIGTSFAAMPFYPLAERRTGDSDTDVREAASYCLNRCLSREVAMPSIIQLVHNLRGFDLFKGMGIRELRAVASVTRDTGCPAGSIIAESNTPLQGLYLVVTGRVEKRDPRGCVIDVIAEGGAFGELGLFAPQGAGYEYAAVEETGLYVLRSEHFIEIIKLYPLVGLNLCRYFVDRLLAAGAAGTTGKSGPPSNP